MDKLEKLVFLEMTNKQFSKNPSQDFFKTYKTLTERESDIYTELYNEIHRIWNYINANINNTTMAKVKSIEDYHTLAEPVSDLILKISQDFNITLKNEITLSQDLKQRIITIMGQRFFDENFGK
jgi:hypothetical protein